MSSNRPPTLPVPARELLRRYAEQWSARAVRGLSVLEDPALPPELIFLDPFAGRDHPLPAGAAGCGPIVAAALGRGERAGVRALLLDEDPVKVEWLAAALRDLGAAGVQPAEGSWDGVAGLESARELLALLDPPAARMLPLDSLRPLLGHGGAELLIRFPVHEIRRLAQYPGSTLADLPPYARRVVEGISAMLGDGRDGWAFTWRQVVESGGERAAEARIVAEYAERLRAAGAPLAHVLPLAGLESSPPEYLLLVSPDPSRALFLNELVFALRNEGRLPWPETDSPLVRYEQSGELQLFGRREGGATRERIVDRVALAHGLAERFAGRTVPYGAVISAHLDTELFTDDLRRALGDLRRDGRALYRSLSHPAAEVAFPRGGTGRRLAAARRRRGADEELSLSLDAD